VNRLRYNTRMSPFDQHRHRIRMEWGPMGVATLGPLCSVLVIVDVLSFSTTVDIAVSHDAPVVPLVPGWMDDVEATAPPQDVTVLGRRSLTSWSLSPTSLVGVTAGTRLGIASPNGARLSLAAHESGARVLAGCLRNAPAVAAAAAALAGPDGAIGVVPCGERWPDRALRPAVEDLIGAGAVISALAASGPGPSRVTGSPPEPGSSLPPEAGSPSGAGWQAGPGRGLSVSLSVSLSPEAALAAGAFEQARRHGLSEVITACSSGQELAGWGFGADVELAARHGVSDAAPLLRDGAYTR
jgi:2-phosphosulfolactate phosphatase